MTASGIFDSFRFVGVSNPMAGVVAFQVFRGDDLVGVIQQRADLLWNVNAVVGLKSYHVGKYTTKDAAGGALSRDLATQEQV